MFSMKQSVIFLSAVTFLSVVIGDPINVFFVTEKKSPVAKNALEAVKNYLEKNTGDGKIGFVEVVETDTGADASKVIEDVCAVLDKMIQSDNPPHIVFDMTFSNAASDALKAITRALTLPTITGSFGEEYDFREWLNLEGGEDEYLVQVMPPGDVLIQVIRKIVSHQNITSAAILFDETFEVDHKYKSLLQNLPTRHIIHIVDGTEAEVQIQLGKLFLVDIFNYFVIGSKDTIAKVINAAREKKMFDRKYAWYSLTKEEDGNGISCPNCANASVVHMYPQPKDQNKVNQLADYGLKDKPIIDSSFYFDLMVRGIKAVNKLMTDGGWPSPQKYTTCEAYNKDSPPEKPVVKLRTALREVSSPETYAPMKVSESKNGDSWLEFDVKLERYNFTGGKVAEKRDVGSWKSSWPGDADDSLIWKEEAEKLNDHFATTVYRVTTVLQRPFVQITKECEMKKGEELTVECFEGYCIELLNFIRGIIPFDFDIKIVPDMNYGSMDKDKNWNGMVSELVKKEADIALGAFSVMAERENVIDFTVPYYDLVGISILMMKPSMPTSLFKFLTVLEYDVWLCILGAYFFTSFLMWIFDRFSPYSYQNNKEKFVDDDEKREFTLKECLWFCMTSLTPQGGGEAPKNMSGRLVAATWWLFGFIIIASYTANLAAFLTVSRLDTPIDSLEELSKQYKIQYSPVNGTSTATYFERMSYIEQKFYEIWKDMSLNDSMDEVQRAKLAVWDYPVSDKYTKMWQAMQETGLPDNNDAAVKRVKDDNKITGEGYAFLGEATEIKYATMTACHFVAVGEEFSRKPFAIGVQKGSPLKDQFSEAILKLLNQRKLETLKDHWWTQNKDKATCDKGSGQSDGISIQNIGGVFIVIFVGIGLACITLAFEYWWYKYKIGKNPADTVSPADYNNPAAIAGFGNMEKTNFNTQYKDNRAGVNMAPVDSPW